MPAEIDYLLTYLSTYQGGVRIANTICVHDHDLSSGRSPGDVANEVDSWLTAKYRALMTSTATVDILRCFRIPDTYGADSTVSNKLLGLAGTAGAGDGLVPREMTLTLSLRSDHTSRRAQGRLELPTRLSSNDLASGGAWYVSSSWWASVATFADALLAGHDVGTLGVNGHMSTRIYSRAQHREGLDPKTYDINSYLRQPRPRWLRRRVSTP
jgi:hypothetical protein